MSECKRNDVLFKELMEQSDSYFDKRIESVSRRAYEYGILAIKNCLFVSGGGLLATPAIVKLSSSPDLKLATLAGLAFGIAVIVTIFVNYLAHINWTLHEQVWEKHKELDSANIRKLTNSTFEKDAQLIARLPIEIKRINKRINCTFYLPHFCALVLFVCFVSGTLLLYFAVGKAG